MGHKNTSVFPYETLVDTVGDIKVAHSSHWGNKMGYYSRLRGLISAGASFGAASCRIIAGGSLDVVTRDDGWKSGAFLGQLSGIGLETGVRMLRGML